MGLLRRTHYLTIVRYPGDLLAGIKKAESFVSHRCPVAAQYILVCLLWAGVAYAVATAWSTP